MRRLSGTAKNVMTDLDFYADVATPSAVGHRVVRTGAPPRGVRRLHASTPRTAAFCAGTTGWWSCRSRTRTAPPSTRFEDLAAAIAGLGCSVEPEPEPEEDGTVEGTWWSAAG
ncbi:hypothetical protein ACFZCT_30660 [Streptomyces qaidamensis]|uniref:hypothetical protein n=1 Tax=Streptomyces qaidamensis TaxID=1783515 RepID=UPI0036E2AE16